MVVGRADFVPAGAPEVLTAEQAAELLQTDAAAVRALADAGELPGRRIGDEWRFLRRAVLAWLGGARTPIPRPEQLVTAPRWRWPRPARPRPPRVDRAR